MPKVSVDDTNLLKILGEKLVVPEFQRPLAWEAGKIQRLFWAFSDYVKRTGMDAKDVFYLGEMVTLNQKKVVDGQQRMIAFTVICAALRDVFLVMDERHMAAQCQVFLRTAKGGTRTLKSSDKEADKEIETLQNPLVPFFTGYNLESYDDGVATIKKTKRLFQINENDHIRFVSRLDQKSDPVISKASFGLHQKTPSITTIDFGVELDEHWIDAELWYHPGTEPDKNSNLFKAYRRIYSEFYYWYNDLEFNCTTDKKTLKPKGNKLVFSLKGSPHGLSPLSLQKGKEIEISYLPVGAQRRVKETVILKTSTMKNTSLNLAFDRPGKNEQEVQFVSYHHDTFGLKTPQGSFITKLKSAKFARTNFTDAADALNYFTVSNNQENREPLWNFDLLHALVHEMMTTDNIDAQQKVAMTENWEWIRNYAFDRNMKLKNRKASSENFLIRYCLAKGVLGEDGKPIEKEKTRVRKYNQLKGYFSNTLGLYTPGTSWNNGVVLAIEDMRRFCEAIKFVADPRDHDHPNWLVNSYDNEVKSLLLILKKFRYSIHYSVICELLCQLKDEEYEDSRNEEMKKLLRVFLHRVVRNFTFKNHEDMPPGYNKLAGKHIYQMYRKKGDGFISILHDKKMRADEKTRRCRISFESWVGNEVKKDGANDHSLSVILSAASKLPFEELMGKNICWLYAFCHEGTDNGLLLKKDKYIAGKLQKDDLHPDAEHVLPKKWRAGESDKTLIDWHRWPAFDKAKHEFYVHSPGNMTLLEYEYNRAFNGETIFFKSGTRTCPIDGENKGQKAYSKSKFPDVLEIASRCGKEEFTLSTVWDVDYVLKRGKMMNKVIAEYFDSVRSDNSAAESIET